MVDLQKLKITDKMKKKGLSVLGLLFLLISVEVIGDGYNSGDGGSTTWTNSGTVTVYNPGTGANGKVIVVSTDGTHDRRVIDCEKEPEECKKTLEIADDGRNPPTGDPEPDGAPSETPDGKKGKGKKGKKKSSAAMNRIYNSFQAYIRTQAVKRGVFYQSKKDRKWYVVKDHRQHTREIKSKIR